MYCPLCAGTTQAVVETIASADIVKLYKNKYALDVSYLFKEKMIQYVVCSTCKLGFFSPPAIGDEKFYTHFQQYGWYYMDDKYEFSHAVKFIKSTDKVLEIGCGKGAFVQFLPTRNYTGLEYSHTAKEIAAARGVNIKNESIEEHVQKNRGAYDVVCHFQVLEHIEHVAPFFRASVECLKIGGLLIISVPNQDSFLQSVINPYLNLPPHHASRWSDNTLEYIQKLFNVQIVELHHEKLAPMHDMMYVRAIIENYIRRKLRIKYKLVDISLVHKIIKGVSYILSQILKNNLIGRHPRPIGHSSVVVYKKL